MSMRNRVLELMEQYDNECATLEGTEKSFMYDGC